jgi:hypothetical protein
MKEAVKSQPGIFAGKAVRREVLKIIYLFLSAYIAFDRFFIYRILVKGYLQRSGLFNTTGLIPEFSSTEETRCLSTYPRIYYSLRYKTGDPLRQDILRTHWSIAGNAINNLIQGCRQDHLSCSPILSPRQSKPWRIHCILLPGRISVFCSLIPYAHLLHTKAMLSYRP